MINSSRNIGVKQNGIGGEHEKEHVIKDVQEMSNRYCLKYLHSLGQRRDGASEVLAPLWMTNNDDGGSPQVVHLSNEEDNLTLQQSEKQILRAVVEVRRDIVYVQTKSKEEEMVISEIVSKTNLIVEATCQLLSFLDPIKQCGTHTANNDDQTKANTEDVSEAFDYPSFASCFTRLLKATSEGIRLISDENTREQIVKSSISFGRTTACFVYAIAMLHMLRRLRHSLLSAQLKEDLEDNIRVMDLVVSLFDSCQMDFKDCLSQMLTHLVTSLKQLSSPLS